MPLHQNYENKSHFDTVIVGAGPVGLYLASSLSEQGQRVAVLETGGPSFSEAANNLNDADLLGRAHSGVYSGRARVLGGTSTLWGGQLTEFRDFDFEERPWIPNSGWPISKADLNASYDNVSRNLGLPGKSVSDAEVWRQAGVNPPDLGAEFDTILTRWLKVPNLAQYYSKIINSNQGPSIYLHSTAIAINCEDRCVKSISAKHADGTEYSISAKNYVIANGTIEAIRLMLTSASDAACPWSNNMWIGRTFQDHLDFRAANVTPIDHRKFENFAENILLRGLKYQPKVAISRTAQRDFESVNISSSFIFNSSIKDHISNIKHMFKSIRSGTRPTSSASLIRDTAAIGKVWAPLIFRYMRDRRILSLKDLGTQLVVHTEQVPSVSSTITLHNTTRNAMGQRKVLLNWHVEGNEVDSVKRYCLSLDRALQTAGLATLQIEPALLDGSFSALELSTDTNHHCGGLRMSSSPSQGVVDPTLRVHGTENLYVAGAATFPTSSFANPTFTALALADRLAKLIGSQNAVHPNS